MAFPNKLRQVAIEIRTELYFICFDQSGQCDYCLAFSQFCSNDVILLVLYVIILVNTQGKYDIS